MINIEAIELASDAIKATRKAIITTHVNPDGDAIGSALALYNALRQLGKQAEIIIDSNIPSFLMFLDGADKIQSYNANRHNKQIKEADTIFFLDLNDIKRVRTMSNVCTESSAKKIMIDHHIDPQDFCNICIVDTFSSSTGELIWKILKSLNIEINKSIAESIYTAILTDTGSFRYDRTTGDLHRIVAELIDCGANPTVIYEEVYNQNSYNMTRLMGMAIASMELFYEGKLAVMTITDEMFRATQTNDDDIEGFVEKTLMIKGVQAGIMITEVRRRDEMRISFRSKGKVNVRDLAFRFGGGGHLNAAGARVTGTVFANMKTMLINAAEGIFK